MARWTTGTYASQADCQADAKPLSARQTARHRHGDERADGQGEQIPVDLQLRERSYYRLRLGHDGEDDPEGAELAVTGTAKTVKVKVRHVRGLGDIAIAYLTTTKTLSIATCLFAKNGTFVFLHVNSPHARRLTQEAIALAKTAASRT